MLATQSKCPLPSIGARVCHSSRSSVESCNFKHIRSDMDGLIQTIHSDPLKLAIVVAGGATQVLSRLLTAPGASNTVLDAAVPYSKVAMAEYLGQPTGPDQSVSLQAAKDMGWAAYRKAVAYAGAQGPVAGMGVTCSLATVNPKKGTHRMYGALVSPPRVRYFAAAFAKGRRTRSEEEALAADVSLQLLGSFLQNPLPLEAARFLPLDFRSDRLDNGSVDGAADVIHVWDQFSGDPMDQLLAGDVKAVEYSSGNVYVDAPRGDLVVLPGSFNPLHEGHREMLRVAADMYGENRQPVFELSLGNADKGLLAADEARLRVSQFVAAGHSVVCTRAPLFTDKAALFPRSLFVVGYDTAVRLVMTKYYESSRAKMVAALEKLRFNQCCFVVAGREGDKGRFLVLQDIDMPEEVEGLFLPLSEADFRMDISSTGIRQAGLWPPTK